MHYESTDSRGLAIYDDGKLIVQTRDTLELHALVTALMLGQTRIAGVNVPDMLTLYGIVGAAVERLKAAEI